VRGNLALNHALLGTGFVAGGIAITITAAHLWPASDFDDFDPNAILEQAPPAATMPLDSQPLLPRFEDRAWVLLSWGKPSDTGENTPSEEAAFSTQLSAVARQALARQTGSMEPIETRVLSRAEIEVLREDPQALAAQCAASPNAVLVVIDVGGTELSGEGYLPWREPHYQLFDCRSGERWQASGRAVERRGDAFPYEQALRDDFAEMLRRWVISPDATDRG
jgi:hypothetical protein